MSSDDSTNEIKQTQDQIDELRKKLLELKKQQSAQSVQEYTFKDFDGNDISLAKLFGDKKDLIVIHNMGVSCMYCTLWADGFIGFTQHFEDRAAFVVVSNDDTQTQKEFHTKRSWNFKMLSSKDTHFFKDMGFVDEEQNPMPGVSTFHKNDDGSIVRIARDHFGPGDDYCAVWHFFDLLKDGFDGWSPKYSYE